MALVVGARVPDLTVEAYVPREHAPRKLAVPARDGSWTALVFYPRDFTFVCPTELHGFAQLQDDFAAEGATLLAASADSYWAHKAWFESHPLLSSARYPVLADTSHALSRAFGVTDDDATFLIDPDGFLRDAAAGRSPAGTLRVLQGLRWRPGVAALSVAA
jgi:peroxiredoxin (alkyl hydroperoxide reductase subunit C)